MFEKEQIVNAVEKIVYKLAQEEKISNRELLEICRKQGIESIAGDNDFHLAHEILEVAVNKYVSKEYDRKSVIPNNEAFRCLVPKCDGVKCTSSMNKELLWDKFYTPQASTTAALRRTIQHSQESLIRLAERYHINTKTVAKWRKRTTVKDAAMGPRQPHSTVLTAEQEATIVTFRRQTLLPLDDCLYALQATIPNSTRSALHRCLQRHGISRLPARWR